MEQARREIFRLEVTYSSLEVECAEASLVVAQKLCGQFARKFQTALPPELRDLVYAHIWDSDTLERTFSNVCQDTSAVQLAMQHMPLRPKYVNSAPWLVQCRGRPCGCFHWWELPFWVQAKFVGLEVAKEAAAAYYRSGLPKSSSKQLEMLDNILSTDHFHVGVRPADHLRRFEIDLRMFNFEDYFSEDEYDDTWLQRTEFKEQFPALLKLRLKRGFELVVQTTWSPYTLHLMGLDLLNQMLPIVNTLSEAGTQFCVLAWHSFLEKNFDVSDRFTLPSEQWVSKWSAKMKGEFRRKRRALRSGSGDPGPIGSLLLAASSAGMHHPVSSMLGDLGTDSEEEEDDHDEDEIQEESDYDEGEIEDEGDDLPIDSQESAALLRELLPHLDAAEIDLLVSAAHTGNGNDSGFDIE
jgi:hypothetical protein